MKSTVIFFFLLCAFPSTGQKMDSDYFEEGIEQFQTENFEEAVRSFGYIVDNYPESSFYEISAYNLALSYKSKGDLEASIQAFRFILESGVQDNDYIGGSIMSNPFANYKHKSSILLSVIFEEMEKYDSALVYLSYSDTLYPLQSDCGNEYIEHAVQQAQNYARIFQKMGQSKQAISAILPHIWSFSYENETFIESLKEMLKDEKSVVKKFDKALKKITIDDSEGRCRCSLLFMETEIRIPDMYVRENDCDRSEIARSVKKSKLYKMLESL